MQNKYVLVLAVILFHLFGRQASAFSDEEPKRVTVDIAQKRFTVQLDLAALFFKSYKCVDSVQDNLDGSLTILFQSTDCFIYETALAAEKKGGFSAVRDSWQESYMKHVDELKIAFEIPRTLDKFQKLTNYRSWPVQVIDSEIKDRPRTVYRNFDFKGHEVRVAESGLTEAECKGAKNCIEVEIAVSLEDDHVFVVYDQKGKLTSEAQFPRRKLKAPLSCNGCHYDPDTRHIGRFFVKEAQ